VELRTRELILERLEQAFIWAGATDFDSGMAQFKKVVDRLQSAHNAMRSRDYLAARLDEMPEPSVLEKSLFLGIIQFLPNILRFGTKKLAETVEDEVPELKRGRPGLDAVTKAQIVAHIGKRHTAGYSLDQAKQSAVRQFEVSTATIQRVWDDRRNRGAVDFRSVLKYLGESMQGLDGALDSTDKDPH
jgi:hypothetical protein